MKRFQVFALAFDKKRARGRAAAGKIGRKRSILNAGNLSQLREQVHAEATLCIWIFVLSAIKGQSCREQVIRGKSEFLVIDLKDAADEQTASDEQKERECDFASHQQRTETILRAIRGSGASFVFEIAIDVTTHRSDRRSQRGE